MITGTPGESQPELTTLACSFGDTTELFILAREREEVLLLGTPDATVFQAGEVVTFVTSQKVLQIGPSQATMLIRGAPVIGSCTDVSQVISTLLQWLSDTDEQVALPVIDFSAQRVIDEANDARQATLAEVAAAQAEAAAYRAELESRDVTIREMTRQLAQYERQMRLSIEPIEALDGELRRALVQSLRNADVESEVAGPLIERIQLSEGLSDPSFPALVREILAVLTVR